MNLEDLLVSYKQVHSNKAASNSYFKPLNYLTYEIPIETQQQTQEKIIQENNTEDNKLKFFSSIKPKKQNPIKGTQEFERAYDEVEKVNPKAKKYRAFLTKVAKVESGFNPYVKNKAGAPAYGYFQFMQDGKKYNNISKYAGTDIETFRRNPQLQIEAAIKLAESFEKGFTEEDKKLAKQQGFTPLGLLGGAWLAGNAGVRKYLKGQGNLSDKKWSKSGAGTTVGQRMKEFNF